MHGPWTQRRFRRQQAQRLPGGAEDVARAAAEAAGRQKEAGRGIPPSTGELQNCHDKTYF